MSACCPALPPPQAAPAPPRLPRLPAHPGPSAPLIAPLHASSAPLLLPAGRTLGLQLGFWLSCCLAWATGYLERHLPALVGKALPASSTCPPPLRLPARPPACLPACLPACKACPWALHEARASFAHQPLPPASGLTTPSPPSSLPRRPLPSPPAGYGAVSSALCVASALHLMDQSFYYTSTLYK